MTTLTPFDSRLEMLASLPRAMVTGHPVALRPITLPMAHRGDEAGVVLVAETISLPPGVSTAALGTAPAYYEVGEPAGAFRGEPPRGVMLAFHGGGWRANGPWAVAAMRPDAQRWRERGWRTVNASYRPGLLALADALWFHDRARRLWGRRLAFGAIGSSSGGHLAMAIAARRPHLACVIDKGGPVEAATLRDQTAFDPVTGEGQRRGPRWAHDLMVRAFGERHLAAFSPGRAEIRARVLVGVAAHDMFTPLAQARDLVRAIRSREPHAHVDVVQLAPGPVRWVHGGVSQTALDDFHAREEHLVAGNVAT